MKIETRVADDPLGVGAGAGLGVGDGAGAGAGVGVGAGAGAGVGVGAGAGAGAGAGVGVGAGTTAMGGLTAGVSLPPEAPPQPETSRAAARAADPFSEVLVMRPFLQRSHQVIMALARNDQTNEAG